MLLPCACVCFSVSSQFVALGQPRMDTAGVYWSRGVVAGAGAFLTCCSFGGGVEVIGFAAIGAPLPLHIWRLKAMVLVVMRAVSNSTKAVHVRGINDPPALWSSKHEERSLSGQVPVGLLKDYLGCLAECSWFGRQTMRIREGFMSCANIDV